MHGTPFILFYYYYFFYFILFYFILFYFILFYFILFYFIFNILFIYLFFRVPTLPGIIPPRRRQPRFFPLQCPTNSCAPLPSPIFPTHHMMQHIVIPIMINNLQLFKETYHCAMSRLDLSWIVGPTILM